MNSNHNEVKDWQKRAGVLTEDDDMMDTSRDASIEEDVKKIADSVEALADSPELEGKFNWASILEEVRKELLARGRKITVRGSDPADWEDWEQRKKVAKLGETEGSSKKYGLSELSIEEKEQLKDYANAIKETKKAMLELVNKSKKIKTEDGRWGGNRYGAVLDPNK